ncbi:GTP binding protein [Aureococcus anophagefferens]|nr:GTP binding protein [Aureococcus anophagefferens]
MMPAPLKIVIVGDGAVGKTCLLKRFTEGRFPETYVPTVFDNAEAALTLDDGRDCLVSLWDTAGQEDYAHLRRMSFPNVHAFVVPFSSTRASSFDNVVRTWLPECAEADATAPVILARTKIDLPSRVDHAMGAALAREVGVGYRSGGRGAAGAVGPLRRALGVGREGAPERVDAGARRAAAREDGRGAGDVVLDGRGRREDRRREQVPL